MDLVLVKFQHLKMILGQKQFLVGLQLDFLQFRLLVALPFHLPYYQGFPFRASNQLDVTATPEPGTILFLGTGLVGLIGYGWRRKQQGVA